MNFGPNPYTDYLKDARSTRTLWERSNAELIDVDERLTPYEDLLLGEWQRCTALGVDVARSKGRRLSDEDFQLRCEAERLLLDTYIPIVSDVGRSLVGVPGMMILTERNSTELHTMRGR